VIRFGGPAAFRETRTITSEYRPGMPLRVDTRNGSIEVRRADVPEVRITARLRARTEDRLRGTRIVAGRETDGTLYVGVRWAYERRYGNEGCSFEILVPEASGLRLETSNAPIRVAGTSGTADLDTSNGEIVAEDHAGELQARTSNGPIRLRRVGGDVVARTSNGPIEVVEASGPVEADTSNARVVIRLDDAATGPIRAATSNGRIDLDVGAGFRGDLRIETSNGRIRVDPDRGVRLLSMSRDAARIRIGEPGPLSTAVTSNGSVSIRIR
jgi:hypothetical protein